MSHPPSTDDLRSAQPLRHAQYWTSSDPLELESGGRLSELTVCFETWGELDATGENAVLVCHALSGHHHAAGYHSEDDRKPGAPPEIHLRKLKLTEAMHRLETQLAAFARQGRREVLVVHGKGQNSPGGTPVLGYDVDPETKRLVVDRPEAERVRSIAFSESK